MKLTKLSQLLIIFYLAFFIISLLGNFIIDFRKISLITYIIFFGGIITLIIGSNLGSKFPLFIIKYKINININKLLVSLLIISFFCTMLGWVYMIKYYGSLAYIFQHGTMIRDETIGNGIQLKPVLISYLSSLNIIGLPLSLSAFKNSKKKKYIIYGLLFFIITIIGDLQTFGRIGILFSIFIIISFFLLNIKNIPIFKVTMLGITLLIILMIPKFIRAGNSLSDIGYRYHNYYVFDIPNEVESLVSIYAYYFSGLYALDYLLDKEIKYEYGLRNLSAIYNLSNRIFKFKEGRNDIIAETAYVPFDTNIYTIIGEFYMDGGITSIIFFSLSIGFLFGYLFRYKGQMAFSLKLVIIAWILESPIYNIFSFGAFFLSFILLIGFTFFTEDKKMIKLIN